MSWKDDYSRENKPPLETISEYIDNPLWQELITFLEESYGIKPDIQYSCCSGAPGWNVKYKKSSRALCTLYPGSGFFTCLVSIGAKEAPEAELLVNSGGEYLKNLYWNAGALNGARWLMIEVTSSEILEETKKLIMLRVRPKNSGF